jgi:hypothetical protein
MFGTASADVGSAARRRASLSMTAEQPAGPALPRCLGWYPIYPPCRECAELLLRGRAASTTPAVLQK